MVSSSKIDLTAPKLFSLKRALYLFTQVMAKGRQLTMIIIGLCSLMIYRCQEAFRFMLNMTNETSCRHLQGTYCY